MTGRELDNAKLLLDTIFYRKSPEVTSINHFVSLSDFMGFERNPMKSYRELDKPILLLDTFCLFLLNKQNTRSDRHKSLCQFEWFHGIRKKSHEIVSRTRQRRLTSRYNFLSKITCLPRNSGKLEVTGINHFISSSDGEATAESLYRELDKPSLTSRYIRLRRTLEVTGINHFVSSSDGEATAESLYRELD